MLAVDNKDWLIGKKLYVNRELESFEMTAPSLSCEYLAGYRQSD